jgi:hypothetical protein
MGWCRVDWSDSGYREVKSSFDCSNKPLGSIQCWETIEWLYNLWSLE